MQRSPRAMGPAEWLLLGVLAMLWGTSFFFIKISLVELPPLVAILARLAVAAVILNLIVVASGQRMPRSAKAWRLFFIMGAINTAIPFSTLFYAQTQITSGMASIINATTPVWTLGLAHVLTRDERLTPNRLAGVLLGLGGVVVMIGSQALGGSGMVVLGQMGVLASSLLYAYSTVFARRLRGIAPIQAATGQVTTAAIWMAPVALIVNRPWELAAPSGRTWTAIVAMAVLSTVAAYIIYFRLLATAGATNVALVHLLVPMMAMLLGTQLLNEQVSLREIIGMGCIAAGLLTIDGRLWNLAKSWFSPVPAAPGEPDETG